jgi:hypothetical protein
MPLIINDDYFSKDQSFRMIIRPNKRKATVTDEITS